MEKAAKFSPLAYLGGAMLCAAGLCSGCLSELNQRMDWYRMDRFQTDSAVGATANAVEKIERRTPLVRPGELIIAGALFLILGSLLHRARQSDLSGTTKRGA